MTNTKRIPLWIHIAVWPLLACFLSFVLFNFYYFLLTTDWIYVGVRDTTNFLEAIKLSLLTTAGFGAVITLVVNVRGQKIKEDENAANSEKAENERYRDFFESIVKGISLLNNSDASSQLTAIPLLSRLANNAPSKELKQICIDVLISMLKNSDDYPSDPVKLVRGRIFSEISKHLAVDYEYSWSDCELDFRDVKFDGYSLRVEGNAYISLSNAEFRSGKNRIILSEISQNSTLSISDFKVTGGEMLISMHTFEANLALARGEVRDGILLIKLDPICEEHVDRILSIEEMLIAGGDFCIEGECSPQETYHLSKRKYSHDLNENFSQEDLAAINGTYGSRLTTLDMISSNEVIAYVHSGVFSIRDVIFSDVAQLANFINYVEINPKGSFVINGFKIHAEIP